MSKRYYKQLIKILREHGCEFHRQAAGSHEIWYSPITDKKFVVVKDGVVRHTANSAL